MCAPREIYGPFGETCCFSIQGGRILCKLRQAVPSVFRKIQDEVLRKMIVV